MTGNLEFTSLSKNRICSLGEILRELVNKIADLTNQVKELRSEFVDRRSELMKLKMESTVSQKMEIKEIFPSTVPPVKIKVAKEEEKNFFKKIWQ